MGIYTKLIRGIIYGEVLWLAYTIFHGIGVVNG